MTFRLRQNQHRALRSLSATIARHHGVLLVLPVGFGKTVVALAYARQRQIRVCVVGPARLRRHWVGHARSMDVDIQYVSFACLSRRRLGELESLRGDPSLLIVDEAHQLRNRATKRYRSVARLGRGCDWLLMSATPVVRSSWDPITVCALFDPRAADACFGHPGLDAASRACILTDLSIYAPEADRRQSRKPGSVVDITVPIDRIRDSIWCFVRHSIPESQLRPFFAGLVERAVASSPGALVSVADSCRMMRSRCEEARANGHGLSRREFYSWFGASVGDGVRTQGVLPFYFERAEDGEKLSYRDCDPALAESSELKLRSFAETDSAAARFLVAENIARPALVYSQFASTVWFLRSRMCEPRTRFVDSRNVWSSASGPHRSRDWSVEEASGASIVATDVLSVGVDLPWMRSVVHLEVPWTDSLLRQREGRATRSPDATLESSVRYSTDSVRGRKVSRALKSRRAAAIALCRDVNRRRHPVARRSALTSRASMFHVKHDAGMSEVREALIGERRGLLVPKAAAHTWVADDWLTALEERRLRQERT